jgi:hypothetical protein
MAEASVPMCSLDEPSMDEQRARYARIAEGMTSLERSADAVRIELAEDFDRRTLEEMVQVEVRCCPFFQFAFTEDRRELTITVDDAQMLPALEAIASELGTRAQAS